MTLEKEQDLKALKTVMDSKFSMSDIVDKFLKVVGNEKAPKLYDDFVKKSFFDIEFKNGSNEYVVSTIGKENGNLRLLN